MGNPFAYRALNPARLVDFLEGQGLCSQLDRDWYPIYLYIRSVVMSRRKIKSDELDDKVSSAILTTVVGADDKCKVKCRNIVELRSMTPTFPSRFSLPIHCRR